MRKWMTGALRRRAVVAFGLVAGAILGAIALRPPVMAPAEAAPSGRYEVWAIDQADVARGGAWLNIYDGQSLESGQAPRAERINLFQAAIGVGDGPGVRPHMLAFNSTHSHAVISNVATGHVYVMRTSDRKIVASIDIGEQVHHSEVSADDRWILAANQNGKRFARIRADFATERFVHEREQDINLAALEDRAHPDNAPICPAITGGKAYITLRGGGMYIADFRATPMRITRVYGNDQVAPAGCGGVVIGDKVYINSGTVNSSDLYVLDRNSDAMLKHLRLGWSGSDGHGLAVTGGGRYLWMGNRADSNIIVINTQRDAHMGIFDGVGTAPDIMAVAPDGNHVYVALRGPSNLTGGPSAKGTATGFAVLRVLEDGRTGRRIATVPIGDQTPASPNDVHSISVRVMR
jgi:DNA-binding beta-propeller fold protein YncE